MNHPTGGLIQPTYIGVDSKYHVWDDGLQQGQQLMLLNTKDFADIGCISLPEGDELIEEIKMVREERKQLEWTRQELLRKGKDLLAQNRNRRNQGQLK